MKKEKNDLKSELERKERLALQAIAARTNIKKFFDESQDKLKQEVSAKQDMIMRVDEAQIEVDYYKSKHDEMF